MTTAIKERRTDPGFACAVIWGNGKALEGKILRDLNQLFDLRMLERVDFSELGIESFLAAFYPLAGVKNIRSKAAEIGDPRAAIALLSPNPNSSAMFAELLTDFKKRIRAKHGNVLHVSDDESEALQNILLLTGASPSRINKLLDRERRVFLFPNKGQVSSEAVSFPKREFRDISELFERLDKCVDYLVLRNVEALWDQSLREAHSDVDLLTNDRFVAETCLMSSPIFWDERRVRGHVMVDSKAIPFDFRFVGDGYFDEAWQRAVLQRRRNLDNSQIKVCSHDDEKWVLLHHILVHKNDISPDYLVRLHNFDLPVEGLSKKYLWRCLKKYMRENNLKITAPSDYSVRWKNSANRALVRLSILYKLLHHRLAKSIARRNFGDLVVGNRKKVLRHCRPLKSNVFFSGNVIIKKSPGPAFDFLLLNEYNHLTMIEDQKIAPSAIELKKVDNSLCLFMSKLEGKTLSKRWFLTERFIARVEQDGNHLLDRLEELGIQHGDINQRNLLYSRHGLAVIDFEFADSDAFPLEATNPQEKELLDSLTNLGSPGALSNSENKRNDRETFRIMIEGLRSSNCTKRIVERVLEGLVGNWSFSLSQEFKARVQATRRKVAKLMYGGGK